MPQLKWTVNLVIADIRHLNLRQTVILFSQVGCSYSVIIADGDAWELKAALCDVRHFGTNGVTEEP